MLFWLHVAEKRNNDYVVGLKRSKKSVNDTYKIFKINMLKNKTFVLLK